MSKYSQRRLNKITAVCDYQISPNCLKQQELIHECLSKNKKRNGGRYKCVNCARTKFLGRTNPNCKYPNLDDYYFHDINTDEKAYILGFIASDGTIHKTENSISIEIHERDIQSLYDIRNYLDPSLLVSKRRNEFVSLRISSKQICDDICNHLKIERGKKSHKVRFPDLSNNELKWAFLRGYFDGDASISTSNSSSRFPSCNLFSMSTLMLDDIYKFVNIKGVRQKNRLTWNYNNCLDLLGKLYDNNNIAMSRKRNLYKMWATWLPSLKAYGTYGNIDVIKYNKIRKDAVTPYKTRITDSGYDLTLLEKINEYGNYHTFSTGIKLTPPFGYYVDLVPRSSIIKYGYMLANSVGIIDRQYVGEILVVLIKVDYSKPDPELPARLVQIIPRQIQHFPVIEVDNIEDTERSSNGFGSSGN